MVVGAPSSGAKPRPEEAEGYFQGSIALHIWCLIERFVAEVSGVSKHF